MDQPEHTVWPAPAKLNLFLRITGRRDDGYHTLQTLYQILDWGDEIRIEATDESGIVRLVEMEGVSAEQDLGIRAAHLLQAETGCRQGARIAVDKRIPQGSGLGGASSNAATVLVALNHLWGCGLDTAGLAELGLRLGADVPLFVGGRSAWAEGIGEVLEPVTLGLRYYTLVFPGIHIPTAEVFAAPGLRRDAPTLDLSTEQRANRFAELGNDCQEVVLDCWPEIRAMVDELAEFGLPRMTGTGSTLFIETGDKNAARRLTSQMKSRYNVRAVGGVDRSLLLDRLSPRRTGGNGS
jgi:4-diphosphocytidyl-2-C-methyl-D-erythritol kinase